MASKVNRWVISCCCGVLLFTCPSLNAQQTRVPQSRLGLDSVRTQAGERLLGFIIEQSPTGEIKLAVPRSWLHENYPELAKQQTAVELAERANVLETLRSRAAEWIAERQDDEFLVGTIKTWLDELKKNDSAQSSLFFVMRLAKAEYVRFQFAKPENRHIAGLAYSHGLENIPTTSVILLSRELQEQGVEIAKETVDLSNQLPSTVTDSLQQWRTRQALIEHQLRKGLEYQGTGENFFRVGDEPNLADIASQLISASSANSISALGAELGLPEFRAPTPTQNWWRQVTAAAELDGFRGVLIKRLQSTPSKVTVDVHFFVQESPGNWFPAVSIATSADPNNQPADRVERLRDDPQVQKALALATSIGVADRIEQALRHGAATQAAMEAATSKFDQYHVRYLKQIDHPAISLPTQ